MVLVIAVVIRACLRRRDLFEVISDYISGSYDFLIDVFDSFTLSLLSDLLPLDIPTRLKHTLLTDLFINFSFLTLLTLMV